MPIPDQVRTDLTRLDLSLDTEQLDLLERFLHRLLEANRRMNLTAIRDIDAAWSRMIVDSLTVLPGLEMLTAEDAVIDVGTGGGLPGIPLAIARPDLSFTLLEATGKKCDYLRGVTEALSLENVEVRQARAEDAGRFPELRQHFAVAVCRAVGPMPVLLELCLPLVRVGGRLLAMKGPKAEQELDVSGDALTKLGGGDVAVIDAYPEGFDNDLVIVSIVKDTPTPKAYPRAPGLPKKMPL
jgi:16S rRNA (guanine527-N7)-methyltransferase